MTRNRRGWEIWFLVGILSMGTVGKLRNQTNDEERLWNYLIEDSGYNSRVRPVYNVSRAINVTFDIAVNQIIEFDEPRMVLRSQTWIRVHWWDELLAWDATEHNGITSLSLPASDIWLPDLTFYSSVVLHPDGVFGNNKMLVTVTSNGDVAWLFPTVIESRCSVDMAVFPFDTQYCDHEFGSWSYDKTKVDVHPKSRVGDASNFIDNGEWELVDIPSSRKEKLYTCWPMPYSSVIYTYVLKRRPMFYFFNMILPCFVITVVSLFSFLIPVESGERITFSITTLLALVVFLSMVAANMPPQSGVVPVIEWYFGLSIIILCLCTVEGVFVYRIHMAGESQRPFPATARRLINGSFCDALAYCKFRWKRSRKIQAEDRKIIKVKSLDERKLTVNPVCMVSNQPTASVQEERKDESVTKPVPFDTQTRSNHSLQQEWKQLANAIDKFFFVLFLLSTASVSLYLASLFGNR